MTKEERWEVYGRCAKCCRSLLPDGFSNANDTVTWCDQCLETRAQRWEAGQRPTPTSVGWSIPWKEWNPTDPAQKK